MERDPGWMLVVAAEAERSPPLTPKHTFKFELMGGGVNQVFVFILGGRGGFSKVPKTPNEMLTPKHTGAGRL